MASKYLIQEGREKEGEEISNLLEKTAFKGDISLVYAKRPNAVLSIKKETENFKIVTARNIKTNELAGVGICEIFKMRAKDEIQNIAYLSGLRVLEGKKVNIYQAYDFLKKFCLENDVKYTYTTILKENVKAKTILTKKRNTMPDYIKISDYFVSIIRKNLKNNSKNIFKKAEEKDFIQLWDFIYKQSEKTAFFPHIDLNSAFFGFNYKDFYILKEKDKIKACGILWNQTDYKQLIVKHYSKLNKIIKTLSNPVLGLLKYPKLPEINEIIKYETLSFVLYENEEYLKEFLSKISNVISFDFFVYGSTKDINFSPLKYQSEVYLVDWEKNFKENFENLYIECALL